MLKGGGANETVRYNKSYVMKHIGTRCRPMSDNVRIWLLTCGDCDPSGWMNLGCLI